MSMGQMRVIIELESEYGHPDNRPSREPILRSFSKRLPELLAEERERLSKKRSKGDWSEHDDISGWSVVSVRVE
jgi:hypothetical protein